MRKYYAVVLTMTLFLPVVAYAQDWSDGWSLLGQASDKSLTYGKTSSIKDYLPDSDHPFRVREAWFGFDYSNLKEDHLWKSLALIRYDCANGRYFLVSSFDYSADGAVTHSEHHTDDRAKKYLPAAPGSVIAGLMTQVCAYQFRGQSSSLGEPLLGAE